MKAFVLGAVLAPGQAAQSGATILAADPQTIMDFFFDRHVAAKLTTANLGGSAHLVS